MASLALKRTLTGFAFANDESIHAARKIKLGDVITVTLESERRHPNLKRWWALCGLIYENSENFGSKEQVSDYLKILAGHCTQVASKQTGEIYLLPKSISFAKMSEEEFQELWTRVVRIVCEQVIPDLDQNELTHEIARIVGAAG